MRARLLIVEDTADVRELLQVELAGHGCEVCFAPAGMDALVAINDARHQGRPFTAVVFDIALPDIDGYTAAQMLRLMEQCNPRQPKARIAFMSAYGRDLANDELIRQVEAERYWQKPNDLSQLPQLISSWLDCDDPSAGSAMRRRSTDYPPASPADKE